MAFRAKKPDFKQLSAGTGLTETTPKRTPPSQLHKRLEIFRHDSGLICAYDIFIRSAANLLNPFINCFSAWYRYIGDLSAERRIFAFAERVERLNFYMLNSAEFTGDFAYSLKMLRTVVKARNYGAAQNNFTACIAQSL